MGRLCKNVFLIGFMGVGKTTVARRLARDLGVSSIDVDTYLRRKMGFDANQLYKLAGEEKLRETEEQVLSECCLLGPAVISCGEGIVAMESCREILSSNGFTVLLESSVNESISRIHSMKTRPLLADGCDTQALWESRKPLYDEAADATIDVSELSTNQAACAVVQLLLDKGIYFE